MRRLVGFFFKSLSFVVSHSPRRFQELLAWGMGILWFDVLRIRRQVALDNLKIAFPEKSLAERKKIARSSLVHMGRTIIEFTYFPFFKRQDVERIFVIEGLEHVQAALAQGRGVLFLSMHVGNGDFAVSAISQLGLKMNLISKEFKARWLNDLWFGMRKKHGTHFISPEKSSFDILRALKRNEIVIFVLDQFMGPPIGVRTKFFGRETGTAVGLALMAERTGAPVIPSYTYRRADGRVAAVFEEPIISLDNGPRDTTIAVMTQAYTDKIESVVRRYPEQWMWIHRRWKEFRD